MSGTPVLEVLRAGLLDTIQDAGRPDAGRWGVPHGGAADPDALAIANALLDNGPHAAALEMTLAGPTLRVLAPTTVALAGAELGGRVEDTGERLAAGTSVRLRAGWTLVLDGPATGGARGYLAVPGGVAVAPVLGSRATDLGAGFGGMEGRALRVGDVLRAASPGSPVPARWLAGPPSPRGPALLRLTPGPHAPDPADPRLLAFAQGTWRVGEASDRMGLRLDGPGVPGTPGVAGTAGDLVSHGVRPGAVQVPPGGRPIVLLADAHPTGGYPVLAVVIAADRPRLGQLRPGEEVRFEVVDRAAAVAVLRTRRLALEAAVRHLREARGWDEQWHAAR